MPDDTKLSQIPTTEIDDPKLRPVIEAVRQILTSRAFGSDRWITMNDLQKEGIVQKDAGGGFSIPTGIVAPDAGGTPLPECMPPPPPTNLQAEGVFTMVLLTWDQPPMPYLNRHATTEIWRSQSSDIGKAVFVGSTPATVYTDNVGPGGGVWWYWIRHTNECGAIGPFQGQQGVVAQTLPDTKYLLDKLTGQIRESQLFADLSARINLIDGSTAIPGSVDQRILNTQTQIQTTTDRLSQEISLLTTGVSGSLDPYLSWYFDDGNDGWLADGVSAGWSTGWVRVTGTQKLTLPAEFTDPLRGSQYMVVVMRVARVSGTGWKGTVRYSTAGHGYDDGYRVDILDPGLAAPAVSGTPDYTLAQTLYWDMSKLTAPTTDEGDWLSSYPTNVEIQLGSDPGDEFAVDYITIGRFGPGASVASVFNEQQARTTADTSLSMMLTQLNADFAGNQATVNAELKTLSDADSSLSTRIDSYRADYLGSLSTTNARIDTEHTAWTNATAALSNDITTLSTTVDGNTASIAAQTSSINGIKAEWTIKADVAGRISGIGFIADAQSSVFQILADSLSIIAPGGNPSPENTPFMAITTPTVIDGVTIQPGVYMKSAFIVDGAITNAKIANATIEGAKIALASIASAQIADGSITTAKIANSIQSSNYTGMGGTGWYIDKTGLAVLNNAYVRGTIYATAGVFAGSLSAATGTFSGALSAATGTFSGALSAATGTFSGTLSAANGTFNTLEMIGVGTNGWIKSTGLNWDGNNRPNSGNPGFLFGRKSNGLGVGFIGSPTGKYLWFDGSDLWLNGQIVGTGNIQNGAVSMVTAGTDATWRTLGGNDYPGGGGYRAILYTPVNNTGDSTVPFYVNVTVNYNSGIMARDTFSNPIYPATGFVDFFVTVDTTTPKYMPTAVSYPNDGGSKRCMNFAGVINMAPGNHGLTVWAKDNPMAGTGTAGFGTVTATTIAIMGSKR